MWAGAAGPGSGTEGKPGRDECSNAEGMDEEERRKLYFIRAQFGAAAPLSGSDPASRYLAGRALADVAGQEDLRYAAAARVTPDGRPCRALIAAVRDRAGEIVAHHLVLLTRDGTALTDDDGRKRKLSFGRVSEGFVHLGAEGAEVMAVAEGAETAMSRLATADPVAVRACVGPLRYCKPPPGTKRVEVIADRDKIPAARQLAQRHAREGFDAFVVEPPEDLGPKADLNDLLARDGPGGVRRAVEDAQRFRASERFRHELEEVGSDVEIAQRVLEALEVHHGPVVLDEGCIWRYHARRREPMSEASLTRLVQQWDGATYPDGPRMRRVRLNRNRIASVIANLVALRDQEGWFGAAPRGLACDSGFVRLADDGTPRLEPHRREHRARHLFPGRWPTEDFAARLQGSLLRTLLTGCFEGDPDAREKLLLLGELAGAAAFGLGTRIKPKTVVLLGEEADNGKSQIIAMYERLVPPDALCSIPPGKLRDERFLPGLAGKLLNVAAELSPAAIASDAFKAVVTGDLVSGREAYGRAMSFHPIAQHVFAANALPAFQGGVDAGVLRRLLVLEFHRRIPSAEQIEGIGRRVAEEERGLLLAFAVRGACRLLRRRGFTVPPSSALALRRWAAGVDPVRGWLDAEVVVRPERLVAAWPVGAAYDHFVTWAVGAGYLRAGLPPRNGFVMRVKGANAGVLHRHGERGGEFLNLTPAPERRPEGDGGCWAQAPREQTTPGAAWDGEDDPFVAALLAAPSGKMEGGKPSGRQPAARGAAGLPGRAASG